MRSHRSSTLDVFASGLRVTLRVILVDEDDDGGNCVCGGGGDDFIVINILLPTHDSCSHQVTWPPSAITWAVCLSSTSATELYVELSKAAGMLLLPGQTAAEAAAAR